MKPEEDRLRSLLIETITGLCKSGLTYRRELKIQGLLGITVDDENVFVVHLDEKYYNANHEPPPPQPSAPPTHQHEQHMGLLLNTDKSSHSESSFHAHAQPPPAHMPSFTDGHSEVAHINSSRAVHPGIPPQVVRERPRSKLARPVPYHHPRVDALSSSSRHTDSASPDIEVGHESTAPPTAFHPPVNHDAGPELLDPNTMNAFRMQIGAHSFASNTDSSVSLNRRSSLSLRGPPTPTFPPTSCPTPTTELITSLVMRHKSEHPDEPPESVHILPGQQLTSVAIQSLTQPAVLTKGAQKRFDGPIFPRVSPLLMLDGRGSSHGVQAAGFRPAVTSPATVHTASVHKDMSLSVTNPSPVNLPITAWTTLPTPGLLAPASTTLTSPLTLIASHSDVADLMRRDIPLFHTVSQQSQATLTEPRSHTESASAVSRHNHSPPPPPHSVPEERQPPPAHNNRALSPIQIRPHHKSVQSISSEDTSCTPPLARATPPTANSTPSSTPTPTPKSPQQQDPWYKRSRHATSHTKPDKTVVSKDVVCLPYEYLREQEDKGLMVLPRRDVRAALADHGLTATIQLTSNSTPDEIQAKLSSAFAEVFRLDNSEELDFMYLSCVPGTRKLQRVSLSSKDKTEKWFGARVMKMAGQGILYIVSDEKYKDRLQIMQ